MLSSTQAREPRIAVFTVSPIVTVTVEPAGDRSEIHIHAGGQGFWVARMAAALGARVTLACALGGEIGEVLRGLISGAGIELRAAATSGSNGAYVHDRRSGERVTVAQSPSSDLTRHELDELYGLALAAGLESDIAVLTGGQSPPSFPSELYGRLAGDFRANGVTAMADLSGEPMLRAAAAGLTLLKVSAEELPQAPADRAAAIAALQDLSRKGADNVVISRAERPALALVNGELLEIRGPKLDPVDERGAGDSMTAAAAVALASGSSVAAGLRMAVAAGALNVTRHGLGSGRREDIEKLVGRVEVVRLPAG